MKPGTGAISGGMSALVLLGLISVAAAQTPAQKGSYLKNIEQCNKADLASLDARIEGCTAFIDARQGTKVALAVAFNNRGIARMAKRDYDGAIGDFSQAVEFNPTYTKPFNNLGVAYVKKGQYDLAIKAFDEAIKLNPNYAEALANRAGAYSKTRAYDRAVRDYDEAIRVSPDLGSAWSGRCWSRAMLGALQAALEDCDKALGAGTNNAASYDSRGLIYLKMGRLS